ncbi:hypothetical protein D3C87_1235380 [compost metagenome]
MRILFDRPVEGQDYVLAIGVVRHVFQVFGEGLAGDGHGVAMQHAGRQHALHQRLNAADGHQLAHHVFAAGAQVGDHRGNLAQLDEVIQGQLDIHRVGHGQQVQHGIGRAGEGDHHANRVFEGLAGHDVAWFQIEFEQLHDLLAGAETVRGLVAANGVLGAGTGQAHAQGFNGRGHGVGGVHAATGTGAGNRHFLDLLDLDLADIAPRVLAHGLEHGNDVGVAGARLDGATIDKDRRAIQPRHADQAARHVLVAAADGHQAVETLATGDHFDGVGDHLAGHQRILHAFGAVGDAVGNGDGVEDHALGTGGIRAFFGFERQFVDVHVAWGDHGPSRGDADLRLREVCIGKAHGPQHGACRCGLHAVDHLRGVLAQIVFVTHDCSYRSWLFLAHSLRKTG